MDKSIQGKAESPRWKRETTLKGLLDLLDQIETCDKTPEEKAKLRQRVIDYGQQLSKEIHEGKRQVPESDDNETIKKFNIRMYSTYDTKGKSSYEEAKRPTGYYNEKGEFVKDPYPTENEGNRNHKNPRWYPIPLKEEKIVIPPHTTDGPTIIPPVTPITKDDERIIPPVTPITEDDERIIPPVTPITNDDGRIIPPVTPINFGEKQNIVQPPARSSSIPTDNIEQTSAKNEKHKKRRHLPLWLIPLIAGTIVVADKTKSAQITPPMNDDNNKEKTENVITTPMRTPAEQDYLRYTVEKGQRMAAKQFGVSVDEGAEIYNQFVENIKQGKMPEIMMELSLTYQMSKMVDKDIAIDLDNPEIMATTWMLMSESYPAIQKTVLGAVKDSSQEITTANIVRLKKYLSMANSAAKKHNVNPDSNLVSTVDYGIYGASEETGLSISYREAIQDRTDYRQIVNKALNKGEKGSY